MSIASQITTMQEHIEDIYDTFAVAGVDTSAAAKNIVNINANLKERLEYYLANGLDVVWNNWNKVSGSGTTLSLNNTIEAKMGFVYKGNTYQYSTIGKNLFNINTAHSNNLSDAGITATFNSDGTITVNGTKNANYKAISYNITLPAGTYYFSGCPSGGSGGGYSIIVQTTNEISSQIFDTGNGATFTLTEQKKISFFPVRVGADAVTFNNAVFKPMIARVPVTYNDYEPYTNGASPNPDYPQDIQVVSGDNTIKVEGKNLFEDEYIDVSRTGRTNAYLIAGTYTLASCDSNNFGKNIYIRLFDKNTKNIITSSGHLTSNLVSSFSTSSYSYYGGGGASAITFTLDNDYYVNVGLLDSDGTRQVMLVKGDTEERTYTPYVSQSYPVSLGVENLINPALFTTTGSYNVASINNGEVIGNSITGYAGVRIALGQNINLKTNDEIYVRLKLKSDVAGDVFNTIQLFNSSNAGITSTEVKLSTPTLTTEYQEYIIKYTIGTDETLNKLFIQHKDSSSNVFIIKDIQISYKNGSYTSYGTTPIELCKIGDYQDSIKKSTGKNLCNTTFELGGIDTTTGQNGSGTDRVRTKDYVEVKPNTTYTLSGVQGSRIVSFYNSSKTYLSYEVVGSQSTSGTFTTPNDTSYIRWYIIQTNTNINEMLNEGETALLYEPYGKVWYLHKEIGKVVLDGTQNWQYGTSGVTGIASSSFQKGDMLSGNYLDGLATYFHNDKSGKAKNSIRFGANNKYIYLYLDETEYTSVNDVKNWLSSHNTTVYYVLATPTYEEITDTTLISQLEAIKKSYDTQTNISQTNADKPFILDVTALKDLDAEDTTPALATNRGLLFTQPPVSENSINDEDDNSRLEETINEEEPNIEDNNREEEEPVDFFGKEIINNDEEQEEMPTELIEIDNGQR